MPSSLSTLVIEKHLRNHVHNGCIFLWIYIHQHRARLSLQWFCLEWSHCEVLLGWWWKPPRGAAGLNAVFRWAGFLPQPSLVRSMIQSRWHRRNWNASFWHRIGLHFPSLGHFARVCLGFHHPVEVEGKMKMNNSSMSLKTFDVNINI